MINKKVLITGGAGFIGSNLIAKLNSVGYKTISIDNYSTGNKDNHNKDTEYYELDISSTQDYNNFIDIDTIVHCAAKARIQQSFVNDNDYFSTNVLGTHNITKFAAKHNISLIYIGSSSHHGGRFSNPYTFTKDIGEDIIKLYQQNFGLQATIARLYNVYGPKELTNENGTLIGRWKYNYWYNLPFIVYGDGSKRRDFTYIDDITDGIYKIILKEKYGHIFEFGRGENYSLKDVINMFEYDNVIYKTELSGEMKDTLASNDETKRILDWNPEYNLEDYIEDIKMNKDFKYDTNIIK